MAARAPHPVYTGEFESGIGLICRFPFRVQRLLNFDAQSTQGASESTIKPKTNLARTWTLPLGGGSSHQLPARLPIQPSCQISIFSKIGRNYLKAVESRCFFEGCGSAPHHFGCKVPIQLLFGLGCKQAADRSHLQGGVQPSRFFLPAPFFAASQLNPFEKPSSTGVCLFYFLFFFVFLLTFPPII